MATFNYYHREPKSMKKTPCVHSLGILIVLTLALAITCQAQDKAEQKVVETISFKHVAFDQIVLTGYVAPAPGSYSYATFKKNGKVVFEIGRDVEFDSIKYQVTTNVKNEVKSAFVFIHGFGDIKYIALWGFQYGCCPTTIAILKADKSGIKKLFYEELNISKIETTHEGRVLYFGQRSFSQGLADIDSLDISLASYSPMLVYDLKKDFQMDSALTKKLNQDNYVFAGFAATTEITVARQKPNPNRKVDTIHPYIFKMK